MLKAKILGLALSGLLTLSSAGMAADLNSPSLAVKPLQRPVSKQLQKRIEWGIVSITWNQGITLNVLNAGEEECRVKLLFFDRNGNTIATWEADLYPDKAVYNQVMRTQIEGYNESRVQVRPVILVDTNNVGQRCEIIPTLEVFNIHSDSTTLFISKPEKSDNTNIDVF